MGKARFRIVMTAGIIVLAALIIAFICVGDYPMSPDEALRVIAARLSGNDSGLPPMQENVIWGLRVPRILASVCVGAALAVSGASYQGVFKNPLVSPDLLGVSSGATVGAASAILLSLGSGYMQAFAFVGGLAAVLMTSLIPRLLKSDSNIMLVLSGIIVGGLMSSIFGLLKYLADPETQLASIVYWNLGSFSYIEVKSFLTILPIIIAPAAVLIALSWRVNVLSLGEREAKSLGISIGRVRGTVMVCATLSTAGAICISGSIGWVGLVIPHLVRLVVGSDNTRVIPASIVFGGIFLLIVDTAARTVGPLELPITILTGIIGAPFYAWLLYRQRRMVR